MRLRKPTRLLASTALTSPRASSRRAAPAPHPTPRPVSRAREPPIRRRARPLPPSASTPPSTDTPSPSPLGGPPTRRTRSGTARPSCPRIPSTSMCSSAPRPRFPLPQRRRAGRTDSPPMPRYLIASTARYHSDTCPRRPNGQAGIAIGGRPGVLLEYNCGILINLAATVSHGVGYVFTFPRRQRPGGHRSERSHCLRPDPPLGRVPALRATAPTHEPMMRTAQKRDGSTLEDRRALRPGRKTTSASEADNVLDFADELQAGRWRSLAHRLRRNAAVSQPGVAAHEPPTTCPRARPRLRSGRQTPESQGSPPGVGRSGRVVHYVEL